MKRNEDSRLRGSARAPATGFSGSAAHSRTQGQACRTQPHPGFQDSPPFFRARLIWPESHRGS